MTCFFGTMPAFLSPAMSVVYALVSSHCVLSLIASNNIALESISTNTMTYASFVRLQ